MANTTELIRVGPVINKSDTFRIKQIKVKIGAWTNKGQIVAILESLQTSNPQVVKVKSGAAGKVLEVVAKPLDKVDSNTVLYKVNTECTHPTLMKDMCAECGADLRVEEKQLSQVCKNTSYSAMVHSIPELRVNSQEAQTLAMKDEALLRKLKKLVLLVDLDQTIIHTTHEEVEANMKNVHHFRLYGPKSPWYHTRIRPHTQKFLENISKLYELHICTFGARRYAHEVASFIDPKGAFFSHRILSRDECFDSRSKTANLSSLFPRGDHMVCIIDDREDVWNFAPNLVHVKPYSFFKNTGDINAPPGAPDSAKSKSDSNKAKSKLVDDKQTSSMNEKSLKIKDESSKLKDEKNKSNDDDIKKDDDVNAISDVKSDLEISDDDSDTDDNLENNKDLSKSEESSSSTSSASIKKSESLEEDLIDVDEDDDYLLHLEDILTTIHTAYYDMYEQTQKSGKEAPDLKTVIPYVRRKTLQGVNIVFSGVIPKNETFAKSKAFRVAKSLGANVTENLVFDGDKEKTTHLIAGLVGTAKVNEAKKYGKIHIVTPDWLWCCGERWEKVEEALFPLSKNIQVTLKPPAHCSSSSINYSQRLELNESLNLNLKFSKDELEGMDKEIDDCLSEDKTSSEDDDDSTSKRHLHEKSAQNSKKLKIDKDFDEESDEDDMDQSSDDSEESDNNFDEEEEHQIASIAKDLEDFMGDEDSLIE